MTLRVGRTTSERASFRGESTRFTLNGVAFEGESKMADSVSSVWRRHCRRRGDRTVAGSLGRVTVVRASRDQRRHKGIVSICVSRLLETIR